MIRNDFLSIVEKIFDKNTQTEYHQYLDRINKRMWDIDRYFAYILTRSIKEVNAPVGWDVATEGDSYAD